MNLKSLLKGLPVSNEEARGDTEGGRPLTVDTASGSGVAGGSDSAPSTKRGLSKLAADPQPQHENIPAVYIKLFRVGKKNKGKRVVILQGYVAPASPKERWKATKIRAMIDTGAEGDFVSPSLMARIGAQAESGNFGSVVEAFGKETPITQRANDISIVLPGRDSKGTRGAEARYRGELLVAPHDLSAHYEIILGQPFLHRTKALWQFGDRSWLQTTHDGAQVQLRPVDDDEPDESDDLLARALGRRSAREARVSAATTMLHSLAREGEQHGMQTLIDDTEAEKAKRAELHQRRIQLAERAATEVPHLVMSVEEWEREAREGGDAGGAKYIRFRRDPTKLSSVGMAPSAPGPGEESSTTTSAGELPAEERARAEQTTARILKEFVDVFPDKLPHIDQISTNVGPGVQIKTQEGTQPIGRYGPRMTPADTVTAETMIKELLDLGFIQASTSDWGAPMFLVDKPDGTKRMVIDYRALNSSTIRNRYPLPRVDELFDLLSGARYFSKIDLRTGYWQIRMAPDSVPKTAFTSRHGHFEWLVLPMGLTNAPAEFMKMMEDTFRAQLNKSVLVFLDDILVFSKTLEEHEKHLREALQQLRAKKLYGKLSKCQFFRSEVEFLGHHIGRAGVRMVEDKVTAVERWAVPTTQKEVERFIGLAGFYRKFIKDFSSISAPLTELCGTKKKGAGGRAPPKKTFRWEATQQRAFDELKRAVVSAPCLALPDMEREFVVHTDASGYATGAVLMQKFDEGLRPVAFLSKKMRAAEQRYPVHEQELLAILNALKAWRHYLSGRRFTVWTDHQSLQYIESSQMATPRQMRWAAWLSEFDFSVRYAPGDKNVVADALSRAEPEEEKSDGGPEEEEPLLLSALEDAGPLPVRIRQATQDDAEYKRWLSMDRAELKRIKKTRDGDLLYTETGQFVVPKSDELRAWIMAWAHDVKSSAHRGSARMLSWIKERVWWSKIDEDVQKYCRSCEQCQRSKPNLQGRQGLPLSIETPGAVGDWLSMDFVGPFPSSKEGNTAVMVVVERLSRYVFFVPCRTTSSAKDVWHLLNSHVIAHTGIPRVIVSDRDTRFTSHFWEGLWEQVGSELKRSTAFHPQTDGQAERAVRTLVEALRTMISAPQDDWEELLPHIARAFNSSVCETTRTTPEAIFLGGKRRTILDAELEAGGVRAAANHPGAQQQAEQVRKTIREAKAAIEKAQQKQREDAAKGRREVDIEVGDEVWLSRENMRAVGGDRARKLDSLYCGPFKVARMAGTNAAELILPPGWKIHPVFNLDKMKKHIDGQRLFPARPPGDDHRGPEAMEEDPRAGGPESVEPADEIFEVESILNERVSGRARKVEFLVKWAGWPVEQATWVLEKDCSGAQHCIDEFRERQERRERSRRGLRAMAIQMTWTRDRGDQIQLCAASGPKTRRINPEFKGGQGAGQPTPGSTEAKQRENNWKNTMWNKVGDAATARPPVGSDGQVNMGVQRCAADTKAGTWCKAHTRNGCLCWVHRAQLNGTQIKDSTLPGAGKGLFARWEFNKGDAIVRYTGDIVDTRKGDTEGGFEDSAYVLEVTNTWSIDAARTNTADGRMINDTVSSSKRTNCKFAFDSKRKIVTIRATRKIAIGEELFINYGRGYWTKDPKGASTRRPAERPEPAPIGSHDNPIQLDSLATRIFHLGMMGRSVLAFGPAIIMVGTWQSAELRRWVCGCSAVREGNVRGSGSANCGECGYIRPPPPRRSPRIGARSSAGVEDMDEADADRQPRRQQLLLGDAGGANASASVASIAAVPQLMAGAEEARSSGALAASSSSAQGASASGSGGRGRKRAGNLLQVRPGAKKAREEQRPDRVEEPRTPTEEEEKAQMRADAARQAGRAEVAGGLKFTSATEVLAKQREDQAKKAAANAESAAQAEQGGGNPWDVPPPDRIAEFLITRPNGANLMARYEEWKAAPELPRDAAPTVTHFERAKTAQEPAMDRAFDCRGVASKQVGSIAEMNKTYRMPARKAGYCRRTTCECCAPIPDPDRPGKNYVAHSCSCCAVLSGMCKRCYLDWCAPAGHMQEHNVYYGPGSAPGGAGGGAAGAAAAAEQ